MYLGSWKIDDVLTFTVNTHTPSTGAVTDADAVPTYRVYEDETGTPILTGSTAKLDDAGTTGYYSEQITLSAANGLEKGKTYTIRMSGTVGGVTGAMSHTFQIEAEVDANIVSDKTGFALSGTQTFNTTGNITGNISGSVGSVTGAVGSVTGAVGSVTGNVGGNVTGSVGSVVGAVGSVTGNVGGNVTGSVGSLVGHTVQTGDTYAALPTNFNDLSIAVTTGLVDLTQAAADKAWGTATRQLTGTQSFNLTGNITGNLSGSVGSLTGHTVQTGDTFALANGASGFVNIIADTNELQTDWVNGGRLDLILDIIAADTTTDIPALIAALENISSANVTTACTSSLNTYDPPTRTEATADKDAIITEVNANETKIDALQTDSTAIKAKTDNLPDGIKKNIAITAFTFLMVDSTDHVTAKTGLTVAGNYSGDGGAVAALTNTGAITEISNGLYEVDLTSGELNYDNVTLIFTASGADARVITIHTST